MMTRRAIRRTAGITALCVLALGAGCDRFGGRAVGSVKSSAPSAPLVETVEVAQIDLADTIEMPGSVEGIETVALYSKVEGFLRAVAVDIGDPVKKGQMLAELDIPEMDSELVQKKAVVDQSNADLAQSRAAKRQVDATLKVAEAKRSEAHSKLSEAQATIDLRETEHGRIEELVKNGSITGDRVDEARYQLKAAKSALASARAVIATADAHVVAEKANLEKAQADIDSAQAHCAVCLADADQARTMMNYAKIFAPFDGLVTERHADPGAFIRAGGSAEMPLLVVARADRVRIAIDLPMVEAAKLDRGDRVVFDRITALPGHSFEGTISRFSGAVDNASRMLRTEIDLDNPVDPTSNQRPLMPGYYGYVRVFLGEYPETAVIPASAVLTDEDGPYVFVVENGQSRRRRLKIGFRDGKIVGVEEGLKGGDAVVWAGASQVADGQEVTTKQVEWTPES